MAAARAAEEREGLEMMGRGGDAFLKWAARGASGERGLLSSHRVSEREERTRFCTTELGGEISARFRDDGIHPLLGACSWLICNLGMLQV